MIVYNAYSQLYILERNPINGVKELKPPPPTPPESESEEDEDVLIEEVRNSSNK